MTEAPPLRIAHMVHGCRTLGPGLRTVVWVRGCARRCPGCLAGPILDAGPALELSADELLARVQATEDEGVTFSGGEPVEQAGAVAAAAAQLQQSGRSVMVYSGFTHDQLRAHRDPAVSALLSMTDILVDGVFDVERQADLLWRGSENQRIHFLSRRYREGGALDSVPGVGVEVRLNADGQVFWVGVPPAGFVAGLRRAAEDRGMLLSAKSGVWA